MKVIADKKFIVIYDNYKLIKSIISSKGNVVHTKLNIFGSDKYSEFKNYIYDNNLYEGNASKINYSELEKVQKNMSTTLFKFDD